MANTRRVIRTAAAAQVTRGPQGPCVEHEVIARARDHVAPFPTGKAIWRSGGQTVLVQLLSVATFDPKFLVRAWTGGRVFWAPAAELDPA